MSNYFIVLAIESREYCDIITDVKKGRCRRYVVRIKNSKGNYMRKRIIIAVILVIALSFGGCDTYELFGKDAVSAQTETANNEVPDYDGLSEGDVAGLSSCEISSYDDISADVIPDYEGIPYYTINDNEPFFDENEITDVSFEEFSELDSLGRCGTALACIGSDIMPTEAREDISSVHPSGWTSGSEPGEWNRCHLIGFQLTGENANEENLITGTRYMNVEGMLPFENEVAEYVDATDNHVMYRVTPVFDGDNLVCSGVVIEASSVEDNGDGVSFNVYCYNVQPDVEIDYATGASYETATEDNSSETQTYILNTKSKRFHKESCTAVGKMSKKNKKEYHGSRNELIKEGYKPCGECGA